MFLCRSAWDTRLKRKKKAQNWTGNLFILTNIRRVHIFKASTNFLRRRLSLSEVVSLETEFLGRAPRFSVRRRDRRGNVNGLLYCDNVACLSSSPAQRETASEGVVVNSQRERGGDEEWQLTFTDHTEPPLLFIHHLQTVSPNFKWDCRQLFRVVSSQNIS